MQVRIKGVKNGRFGIEFVRPNEKDGFYTVYGNKIIEHNGKRFISGPAFKGSDDKWVNQTWADDKFQTYVIGLVDAVEPPIVEEAKEVFGGGGDVPPFNPDDDIPFALPLCYFEKCK